MNPNVLTTMAEELAAVCFRILVLLLCDWMIVSTIFVLLDPLWSWWLLFLFDPTNHHGRICFVGSLLSFFFKKAAHARCFRPHITGTIG